jgi:hypothetical protein
MGGFCGEDRAADHFRDGGDDGVSEAESGGMIWPSGNPIIHVTKRSELAVPGFRPIPLSTV